VAKIDANNDGLSSAFDVLIVINQLAKQQAAFFAAAQSLAVAGVAVPAGVNATTNVDSASVVDAGESLRDDTVYSAEAEQTNAHVRPSALSLNEETDPDLQKAIAEIADDIAKAWWRADA
jgi:hypothetical protein